MRYFSGVLALLVIIGLALTGCDIADGSRFSSDQYDFEADVIQPTYTAIAPGILTDPTATPIPQETDEVLVIRQAISCEQSFCQIEWPGWLVRPFIYPARDRIDLTYPYGSTRNGTLAIHHGVEFPNPYGTPVHAAAGGKVVYAGNDDKEIFGPYQNFYGKVVILQHDDIINGKGLYSLYGHLSEIDVNEGEMILAGDVLGQVGTSGVADGSHLHFEVRYEINDYRNTTNPVLWFTPLANLTFGQSSTLAGFISDPYGNPIPDASITLEKLSGDGEVEKHYYFKSYAENGINSHPALNENFTMPDLPPGDYRLTFISGTLYEIFFSLEQGMLGFINLQIN